MNKDEKQHKKMSKAHKRKLLIIIFVVAVLVCGAVGGWLVVYRRANPEQTKQTKKTTTTSEVIGGEPTPLTPEQYEQIYGAQDQRRDAALGAQASAADAEYAKTHKDGYAK